MPYQEVRAGALGSRPRGSATRTGWDATKLNFRQPDLVGRRWEIAGSAVKSHRPISPPAQGRLPLLCG